MNTIVRIKKIEIENLKNIKHGEICGNSSFEKFDTIDIVGVYGQNGTGKTALVEAFLILRDLLVCDRLPVRDRYLLFNGEDNIKLNFDFLVIGDSGEFNVRYEVRLEQEEHNLKVVYEEILYRENVLRKRYKSLIRKSLKDICIRNVNIEELDENTKTDLVVENKLAAAEFTSLFFRDDFIEILKRFLSEKEFGIVTNLYVDFMRDFYIIDNEVNGLILANIMMPFNVDLKGVRENISYLLNEVMKLNMKEFNYLEKAILQINLVIQKIIPGLQVEINILNKETLDDGSLGVKFEFLSVNKDLRLPLRCESAGVLKLISIMSTLISVYNNPNACVVIDELDSGIFEYLLGELLEVISGDGKGQLVFTSHNLRILEVLDNKNLWFTTVNNENRFIKLKGIKRMSNARDIYIRAVQLGGQSEGLYEETNAYDIKKAFRKAGISNY